MSRSVQLKISEGRKTLLQTPNSTHLKEANPMVRLKAFGRVQTNSRENQVSLE
jgi:hypothetical protein